MRNAEREASGVPLTAPRRGMAPRAGLLDRRSRGAAAILSEMEKGIFPERRSEGSPGASHGWLGQDAFAVRGVRPLNAKRARSGSQVDFGWATFGKRDQALCSGMGQAPLRGGQLTVRDHRGQVQPVCPASCHSHGREAAPSRDPAVLLRDCCDQRRGSGQDTDP